MTYNFLSGGKNHGGGAQSIQVLLIKELSKRGKKCRLFDTKDGSVYAELLLNQISFDFVETSNFFDRSSMLNSNDLLIVFDTNLFGNIALFGNSDCKVLVWEIFFPWVNRFVRYKHMPIRYFAAKYEKLILNEISQRDAFFFIDNLGKEAVERRLGVTIHDKFYLPIPIKINNKTSVLTQDKNQIVLSYVGRSVDWKVYPLLKIFTDLSKININKKIVFNVICTNRGYIEKMIADYNIHTGLVEIRFFENLNGHELVNILQNSDLHFAMGTAALDGAKLGIPTVLMDFSYSLFPNNYFYSWLFESKKLNLGNELIKESLSPENHTMEELIIQCLDKKFEIGNNCLEYAAQNYSVDVVIDKIESYAKNNSTYFNFRNISKLLITKHLILLKRINLISLSSTLFSIRGLLQIK